jgi:hypothetical protein
LRYLISLNFRDTQTQNQPAPSSNQKRPQGKRQYVPKTNSNNNNPDQHNNFHRKTPVSTGPRAENTDQTTTQPRPAQPKQRLQPANKPKKPNNNVPEPPKSFKVTVSDLDLDATKDQLQQIFESVLKVKA